MYNLKDVCFVWLLYILMSRTILFLDIIIIHHKTIVKFVFIINISQQPLFIVL